MADQEHDDGGPTVAYTTKELLARIEGKLDKLDIKIDQKASQASVDLLDIRLKAVESEVQLLKASRAQLTAIVAVFAFFTPIAAGFIVHYL